MSAVANITTNEIKKKEEANEMKKKRSTISYRCQLERMAWKKVYPIGEFSSIANIIFI